mmetsp:Transcript_93289/g.301770  ORF Transcript_93289/g.301770 Transcript_93289/m.301770 type:complete len:219 (+) Transcript_93289:787-1443(+)
MGASDELPLGSHFSSPVSGFLTLERLVLQHSNAASRADRTPTSRLPSTPLPSILMPPTVGSKPLPSTSYLAPAAHMLTIVILPSVRVPVLSLQMTDAEPKVSTAASLRTSTFLWTMSLQPMDREIVTQSGMPSGMAATAKVTAMRIMYNQAGLPGLDGSVRFMATPMMKITMQTMMAIMPMRPPNLSKFCCRGVALAEVSGKQPHFVFGFPPSSPAMS